MSAICAILPLADQRRTTALVRLRGTSGMAGPDEGARALWKAPERAEPHAGQALTAFSTGPRSRPSLTRSQTTASEATPLWASFLGDMAKRGGPEPTISSPPAPARTFTNDAGAYLWIEKAEPGQPLSKPGLAAHVWGCARAVLSSRHCEQAVAVRQSQRSMSGGLSLYAAIGRPQLTPPCTGLRTCAANSAGLGHRRRRRHGDLVLPGRPRPHRRRGLLRGPRHGLRPLLRVARRPRDTRSKAGNPGKPKGTRHRATLMAEALIDGSRELLVKKCVEMALGRRRRRHAPGHGAAFARPAASGQ
jgi:hypothetical protein